jgi:RimJ/RimL family protein N-acetyltransferase
MIKVRKASRSDSKDIHEWRNDELTRKMSLTSDYIEWDDHVKWFESSLINDRRLLLICEESDSKDKYAFVKFEIQDHRALTSINLSPCKRGKGLAYECLKKAISFCRLNFPSILFFDAEIKKVNLASKQIFEKSGFNFTQELKEVLYYELTIKSEEFS